MTVKSIISLGLKANLTVLAYIQCILAIFEIWGANWIVSNKEYFHDFKVLFPFWITISHFALQTLLLLICVKYVSESLSARNILLVPWTLIQIIAAIFFASISIFYIYQGSRYVLDNRTLILIGIIAIFTLFQSGM